MWEVAAPSSAVCAASCALPSPLVHARGPKTRSCQPRARAGQTSRRRAMALEAPVLEQDESEPSKPAGIRCLPPVAAPPCLAGGGAPEEHPASDLHAVDEPPSPSASSTVSSVSSRASSLAVKLRAWFARLLDQVLSSQDWLEVRPLQRISAAHPHGRSGARGHRHTAAGRALGGWPQARNDMRYRRPAATTARMRAHTMAHRRISTPPCCLYVPQHGSAWLKWLVFDALLSLVVNLLAQNSPLARTIFVLVGWM